MKCECPKFNYEKFYLVTDHVKLLHVVGAGHPEERGRARARVRAPADVALVGGGCLRRGQLQLLPLHLQAADLGVGQLHLALELLDDELEFLLLLLLARLVGLQQTD